MYKSNFKQAFFICVISIFGISVCFAENSIANNSQESNQDSRPEYKIASSDQVDLSEQFLVLLISTDPLLVAASLSAIKENWHNGLIAMSLEVIAYTPPGDIRDELLSLMHKSTGQTSITGIQEWYAWLWNQNIEPALGYNNFKANLYRNIDPLFEEYFRDRHDVARIRLDEIRWGGVGQDGIPPLRNPEMIDAEDADYLEDDNIVFGIEINGDARAYPKRILAWHEMFTDTIGGVDIAGVYCTLCGTVIPYKTSLNGTDYTLGTSGFLYRSNKLMYDKATQSLWSTSRGVPVLGPLVDKGIELEFESVVTTTWGEWRKRHPKSTVLSLNTGHRRDYGEGVAYSEYFGSDRLMFNTPFDDQRLANKQEVLALRFPAAPNQQLAIDTKFLAENPLYKGKIGQQEFIVLTDESGANRVYDPKGISFKEYDQEQTAIDDQGNEWKVQEGYLLNGDDNKLNRLPYHRAFWFGWHAAFPETQLIK